MKEPISFQSLSLEEKIDFFLQCQKLLVENHPNSEFLLTKEKWSEKKFFAINFIKQYKGYVYRNDRICLLFNKIKINDPKNPIKELKDHLFKEPDTEGYNTYSIDFVVFRKMSDSLSFIKSQDNPKIEFIIYAKNNDVKLFKKEKLLQYLNSPLITWV